MAPQRALFVLASFLIALHSAHSILIRGPISASLAGGRLSLKDAACGTVSILTDENTKFSSNGLPLATPNDVQVSVDAANNCGSASVSAASQLSVLPSKSVVVVPAEAGVVTRLNLGGAAYTDAGGWVWAAETGYTGGHVSSTKSLIRGTTRPVLYQTERYGLTALSLAVPSKGAYIVQLHVAEQYWNASGKRVFDVLAQGVPLVRGLDIFARVGKNNALVLKFALNINSTRLDLVFVKKLDNPTISAVELLAAQPPPPPPPPPATTQSPKKYLRGIQSDNFGYTTGFGDGYGPALTTVSAYKYLAGRGIKFVRLHVLWGPVYDAPKGLQPVLGQPLDPEFISRLHQEINNIKAAGLVAVIDLANSCRYPTPHSSAICGNGVTIADVKDIWTRLSAEFQNESGVYAYDIMNEPYNISSAIWHTYSQAMVDAIRARGDKKLIWVEGIFWSSARNWEGYNGAPWIHDPANNIEYSAHEYPPTSNGGTWKNPEYSPANEVWLHYLGDFITWCKKYGQRCGIGELSVPTSRMTSTWQQWNDLLERFYQAADAAGLTVSYYTANSSWMNQPNSAYIHGAGNTVDLRAKPGICADFDTALSPTIVIERHPSQ